MNTITVYLNILKDYSLTLLNHVYRLLTLRCILIQVPIRHLITIYKYNKTTTNNYVSIDFQNNGAIKPSQSYCNPENSFMGNTKVD